MISVSNNNLIDMNLHEESRIEPLAGLAVLELY